MNSLPFFVIVALLVVDRLQADISKKDDSTNDKSAKYGTIIGIDLGTTYRLSIFPIEFYSNYTMMERKLGIREVGIRKLGKLECL